MRKKPKIKVYLIAYHPEVTGSRFLLVIEFPDGRKLRILVDCGYFQEIKYRHLNYVDDLDPKTIDAIIITHNHADHTGLLPKFVRNGFDGKIYMSSITQELCSDFLMDMCSLQSRNAHEMEKLYPKRASMFKPLYYKNDVERTLTLIEGKEYDQPAEILPGVTVTFYKNAHILGASFIFMKIHYKGIQDINMFFTGDYRLKNCFFEAPKPPKKIRKLPIIMFHEATYGNTTSQEIKKCFMNLSAGKRKV